MGIMKQTKNTSNLEIQKTNDHVRFFLRAACCPKEVDELAIRYFCTEVLKVPIRFASPVSKTTFRLTFDQFKEWLYEPSPSNGDFVVYENLENRKGKVVVKVRFAQPDGIRGGATFCCVDRKMNIGDEMFPKTGYREPTDEEVNVFRYEFSKIGMEWSLEYNVPIEKYIPIAGNYVCFQTLDGTTGMGVFREKEECGQVYMFCVKYEGDPIQYSMKEIIGDIDRLKFTNMTELEKVVFKEELEKVGKSWNPYIKRVEDYGMRVERGQKYYCINDNINISTILETESSKDNLRFAAGNYFRTKEQALKARAAVMEVLKLILAAPLSGLD